MARRKARVPQGKKLQPAVKMMRFILDRESVQYIDLSQCASLVNRRFYRQGLNWAVAGFTIFTDGGTGSVNIYKIPDTWVASNAWHKGFAAWDKMNSQALEEAESIKPKFNDFKVYMDEAHHEAGVGANLIPVDQLGNPYITGTWDMSSFRIPVGVAAPGDTSDREIIWTGANYPGLAPVSGLNAVSLIEGYAASRGLPDILDPNTPDDADSATGTLPENWLAATFSDGTEQDSAVLSDLQTENENAPYPFENGPNPAGGVFTDTQYPGGANQAPGPEIHDAVLVTTTTVGGKTTIPGSNFQGGLIKISNDIDSGNVTLQVHLVPGHHRGYMCQKMQDV